MKILKLVIVLLILTSICLATKVTLTWNASPTQGVTYNIYRSLTTNSCKTTKIVSGVNTLTYDDTTITPGTTYFYSVSAQNVGGESASCSNEVQIAVPSIPLPPSNLQGTIN